MSKVKYIIIVLILGLVAVGLYKRFKVNQAAGITIKSRFQGPLLGGVDNNAGVQRLYTLSPCAKSEDEVRKYFSQLLSYGKCEKDNLGCDFQYGVPELVSVNEVKKNFSIKKDGYFYLVTKLSSTYDYFMQSSNNVQYMDVVPKTWYVCNSDYYDYLNTGYKQNTSVYYPYDIDKSVLSKGFSNTRLLNRDYLNSSNIGVAKFGSGVILNRELLSDFANLLYELGYFTYGGFMSEDKIISRDVTHEGNGWTVTDIVSKKVFNDTPPFNTTSYKIINSVLVDDKTMVAVAQSQKQ